MCTDTHALTYATIGSSLTPDPAQGCGPYKPSANTTTTRSSRKQKLWHAGLGDHDTIAMIVVDGKGRLASGTTTNGARLAPHVP